MKGGEPALVTMKHAAAGTPGRYKKRGEQTASRAQTDSRPIAIKEITAVYLEISAVKTVPGLGISAVSPLFRPGCRQGVPPPAIN